MNLFPKSINVVRKTDFFERRKVLQFVIGYWTIVNIQSSIVDQKKGVYHGSTSDQRRGDLKGDP